ncbi:hypothetical protein EYB45_09110 [Erythrobacteraceae bacterium CFH 75059]|nr:hypothetical protein EYB45_09110 [Erythrobacteraceae bacterium CFH 75059]
MGMISRYDPRGGLADFWRVFRRPDPLRWPILAASAMLTGTMLYIFAPATMYAEPARPEITYVTSFAPDRTEEEIAAAIAENQRVQDALRRLEEQRVEERKAIYRSLGRATGLDVDAMEARIRAEEAAAEDARQTGATRALNPATDTASAR